MSRQKTVIIPQEQFDNALLTSFIVVIIVAAVAITLFYILRTFLLQRWYKLNPKAPYEKNKYFSWILDCLYGYGDEKVLKTHGLDTLMYFWIQRCCIIMVLAMCLYSLFFSMPFNIAGSRRITPEFNITKYYQNGTNNELSPDQVNFNCRCVGVEVENITFFPTTGTAIQTISNINATADPDKYFLITHTFFVIYTTFVFIGATFFVWTKFMAYRMRYKLRVKPENFTVRLSGYDKKKITSEEDLKDVLENMFGKDSVQSIQFVPMGKGIGKMGDLKKKRFALAKKKEGALFSLANLEKKRIKKGGERDEKFIKKEDALKQIARISHAKILKCDKRIDELFHTDNWEYTPKEKWHMKTSSSMPINFHFAKKKKEGLDPANDSEILNNTIMPPLQPRKIQGLTKKFISDVAYVTFKRMVDARLLSGSFFSTDVKCSMRPAASPSDICWSNHTYERITIKIFVWKFVGFFVTVALCLLWVIPVAFAVSLANLPTIKKYLPILTPVVELVESNEIGSSFVIGFLPQVIIIIFFILLVPLLKLIENIFDKSRTFSKQEAIVSNKYFAFRVVNIFFGGILANAFDQIASQLVTLANSPLSIVPILGKAIPLQTNFYTQYVLVNGLMSASLKLLDLIGTLIHVIIWKFFSGTGPRAESGLYSPGGFSWIKSIPAITFMYLVVVVFSALSPLLLLCGLVFFCVHYFADRYVLLYRKVQKWESGGSMWPTAFQQLCFSILLYEVVMLGVFINQVWTFGIVTSALCFFLILLYLFYMETMYRPLAFYGNIYPRIFENDKRVLHKSSTYEWDYVNPTLLPVHPSELEILPTITDAVVASDDEELAEIVVKKPKNIPNPTEDDEIPYSVGDDEEELEAKNLYTSHKSLKLRTDVMTDEI